ncbi:hypothetical protein ACB092_12G042700, partial [Castanea dentata]
AMPGTLAFCLSYNYPMCIFLSESNCLSKLTKLTHLNLSRTHFDKENLSFLGALPVLKSLDLSYTHMKGPLSGKGMYIFEFSSSTTGIVPSSSISSMTSLEYIDLSKNSFEGLFSFSLFTNHSKLKVIRFLSNNNKLEIETDNPRSFPTWLLENNTELQVLSLQGNSFTGQLHLPPYLNYLHWLDVSENYLDGELPENIGMMIPKLECLNVSRNKFKGNLPSSIGDMSNLKRLDLSFNNFSGEVTTKSFANQTTLGVLSLSNNNFHGDFFSKLANLSGLLYLGLNNNHFSGTLPLITSLLDVRHILLRGNRLTGTLPKAVFNSSSLVTLDIKDNRFSGSIPDEIDGPSGLSLLSLSGNNFSGIIPRQLCRLKNISIMDLSNNFFSGTIPYCFYNITFGKSIPMIVANSTYFHMQFPYFYSTYKQHLLIREISYQERDFQIVEQVGINFVTKYRSNSYKGAILKFMSGLDLSFNKLTGEIPTELGQLSSIHALNLSYNQLTSSIPKTFSELTQLESLDLSHNNLSGEIPTALIDLTFLAVFNVAHNNLSGKLPDMKAQFATFNESSYEGNPFLCGPPLKKSCSVVKGSPPSPQNSSKASDRKWYEVDLPVFSTSFLVSFTVFFLGVVSILYINPHWRQQCFNLVEDRMFWCYYFASKTLKRLSNRMFH